MLAGNMFFDNWFNNLSYEDKQLHENDCPICGYKLEKIGNNTDDNIIMKCNSCGYTEILHNIKVKEIE